MFNFHVHICEEYLSVKLDAYFSFAYNSTSRIVWIYFFIFHSSIRYKSEDF